MHSNHDYIVRYGRRNYLLEPIYSKKNITQNYNSSELFLCPLIDCISILIFCIFILFFIRPYSCFCWLIKATNSIIISCKIQIFGRRRAVHHVVFYFNSQYSSRRQLDFTNKTFKATINYDHQQVNFSLSSKLTISIFSQNSCYQSIAKVQVIGTFIQIQIIFIKIKRIFQCFAILFFCFLIKDCCIAICIDQFTIANIVFTFRIMHVIFTCQFLLKKAMILQAMISSNSLTFGLF